MTRNRAPSLTKKNVVSLANVYREALRYYLSAAELERIESERNPTHYGATPPKLDRVGAVEVLWESYDKALLYPLNIASATAQDILTEAQMLAATKPYTSEERVEYPDGGPVFLHWHGANEGTVDRFISIAQAKAFYATVLSNVREGGTKPAAVISAGRLDIALVPTEAPRSC